MKIVAQTVVSGLTLLTALTGFSAGNILWNAGMSETDNLGDPLGWTEELPSPRYFVSGVVVRPRDDGSFSVDFDGPKLLLLKQTQLTLLPGGRYRMGCEVRTDGGNVGELVLHLHNSEWNKSHATAPFPKDSHGEWVRVETSFEAPKTSNPSNYVFSILGRPEKDVLKAKARVRNLELVALDEGSAVASKGCPTEAFKPFPVRIVPIDPLLAQVSAVTGEMTFYFPGVPRCEVDACILAARVDGGKPVKARLAANGRAKVAFGALVPGEHKVEVAVADDKGRRLALNTYRIVARAPVPDGPRGVRLNNFVVQLVKGRLADGETRFYRPEDGWVWISFEGACGPDVKGWLDGAEDPVLFRREGERRIEAQRYVRAGWHTLKVGNARGGTLRIHAVKTLATIAPNIGFGHCESTGLRYNLPFARRFDTLFTFNTVVSAYDHAPAKGVTSAEEDRNRAFFAARGMPISYAITCGGFDPRRRDYGTLEKTLRARYWENGLDIAVDENQLNIDRLPQVNYAEAAWKMVAEKPGVRMHVYLCDTVYGAYYTDPHTQTSEISSIVNSGDGTAFMGAEIYPMCFWDPKVQGVFLDKYARLARTTVEMVPAARRSLLFWTATYVENAVWNNYTDPSTDLKQHYAWFLHKFATQPEFESLGGLGYGGIQCGDEELHRWMAKCVRYYALEGGREDLAARYGFALVPGILRNPDFNDGLDGWTAEPAEDGGVAAIKVKDFGSERQGRRMEAGDPISAISRGMGDGLAVFTSSAKGPNLLKQKITGLVPGRCYALQFTWMCGELAESKSYSGKRRYSLKVEGMEDIRELARGVNAGDFGALVNAKRVFRAKATEATVVFSDRGEDGSALAPGKKQLLNYIIFRPYYLERPEELDEVITCYLGGKEEKK